MVAAMMKRYLIRPVSSSVGAEAGPAGLDHLESNENAQQVKDQAASGQRIMHMSPQDAEALAAEHPELIVEEDKPLQMFGMPDLAFATAATDGRTWEVTVTSGEGEPIPGCTIFASGPNATFRGETDASGKARLQVEPDRVERVIVSPREGYWSQVVAPPANDSLEVTLRVLDHTAAMQKLRQVIGLPDQPATLGRNVRLGVIDSGIAPVAGLTLKGGLNTLDNGDPTHFDRDDGGHGTHVAGLIAAQAASFTGLAPAVELYSLKVFPGGYTSDLVEAIDWCRLNGINLVNMSLGMQGWSNALDHAIRMAIDAGVTLVAATGNDAIGVAFPASHPDVIAVGAIGATGSFPEDSAHELRIGKYRDSSGKLFSASFTNFGPEVDVCAQGVAVASSVPQGFAAWDGTSMATPVVTALLAHVLELRPDLRSDTVAAARALHEIIRKGATDIGIPAEVQGAGLPTMPGLLAAVQENLHVV